MSGVCIGTALTGSSLAPTVAAYAVLSVTGHGRGFGSRLFASQIKEHVAHMTNWHGVMMASALFG